MCNAISSTEKTGSTLRRHKTLPGPLRSFPTRRQHVSAMRLSKSNPYVGWFRHAPPSLKNLTAEAAEWLEKTSLVRHRSTSFINNNNKSALFLLQNHHHQPNQQQHIAVVRALKLHWMVRHHHNTGMLLGGTTDDSVLSKLAYWLLDVPPIMEEEPSTKKCCSVMDDSSSSSDDDDDELTMGSSNSSRPPTRRAMVPAADDDRLDYNITQMDIVRMNRIASRHLDVESIINLPTITYQKHQGTTKQLLLSTTSKEEEQDDNSFSWMLVHSDSEASDAEATTVEEGCVICLEAFTQGDRLRILPCKHKFHISCIDRWLSGSNSESGCVTSGCPTCKAPTATEDVPGWAFARIGDALLRESQQLSSS